MKERANEFIYVLAHKDEGATFKEFKVFAFYEGVIDDLRNKNYSVFHVVKGLKTIDYFLNE